MNYREFMYLRAGARVVWIPDRKIGIVTKKLRTVCWVKWEDGRVDKLVLEEDAAFLGPLPESMHRRMQRAHALYTQKKKLWSLVHGDDTPPDEQQRILQRIAEMSARKKANDGKRVVMEFTEDVVEEPDEESDGHEEA